VARLRTLVEEIVSDHTNLNPSHATDKSVMPPPDAVRPDSRWEAMGDPATPPFAVTSEP